MRAYRAVIGWLTACALATGLTGAPVPASADGPVSPARIKGSALDPASIIRPGRGQVGTLRLGMRAADVERTQGTPTTKEGGDWYWGDPGEHSLYAGITDGGRVYSISTYTRGQRVLTTKGPRLGQGLNTFIRGLRRVYRRVTGRCSYGRCSYELLRRTGARERLILLLDDEDAPHVLGVSMDVSIVSNPR